MTEYKWYINRMDCIPKEGEMTDIVSAIYWSRLAEQYFDGELIQVSINGIMLCSSPSETDFTAYADLTFEQICQWLDSGLNVSEIDSNLDSKIDNIINPPIINLPLPFEQ